MEQTSLIKKKNKISAFVNAAHIGSINLSWTLSRYITQIQSLETLTDNHRHIAQNYIQLQSKIYGLTRFIEENFGMYCTLFKYPFFHSPVDSPDELKLRLATLKLKLQQQCNDAALLNIVLDTAEEFFNARALNIYNYTRFIYLKKYIYQLEKLLAQNKTTDIIQELKDCLIFLNYNKFSFVDYIMMDLKAQIDEIEAPSEKISRWYLYLKEFKQLQHIPEYALFPESPSLKKIIICKVSEEIIYLENQEKLATTVLPKTCAVPMTEERLLTSLSVSQLALFTRLLIDSGMVQTKNQLAVLRKIAASTRTTKTDSISFESLRTKYYNPESASINIIKDHLLKMINQLRNY